MGFSKSGAAGSIRGKVGDKIYRKVNGETVVGQVPEFINVSYSPGCLKTRFRFKVSEELSKVIKSEELLYGIWDKMKPVGANKFSRIMKANSGIATSKGLNISNVITPKQITVPHRFRKFCTRLGKNSIGLTVDSLYAEMRVHRSNNILLVPPYTAYFILYLARKHHSEDFPEFKIMPFKINVQEETTEIFQHYETKFDEQTKDIIRQYNEAVVFFALVKFNDEVNKYEWSETVSLEVLL
jgi:predicted DNA-binding antitoxin AbrB/MazE fold protein